MNEEKFTGGWADDWSASAAKSKAAEATDTVETAATATEENKADVTEEVNKPKKRGRKPKAEKADGNTEAAEDTMSDADKEEIAETIDAMLDNKALLDVIEERLAKKGFQFDKRRVHTATPEARKELYSEKESVVAVGKEKAVKTDAYMRKQEYKTLYQAARSVPRKICWGEINGYVKMNDTLCVTVTNDELEEQMFMIIIPVTQLFPYNEADYVNAQTGHNYMENELKSRIGSRVCYCIFDVLEERAFAIASRLSAMEQIAANTFKKIKNNGEPVLKVGDITNAEVVSVRQDRLKVFINGAEATIKSADLSWTALGPVNTEFSVGDTIPVKILDIEQTEYTTYDAKPQTYRIYRIKASRKEATEHPAKKYISHFREGQVVSGTIKLYTEAAVFVNMQGKMDCRCPAPAVGRPIIGSRCVVRITNIYPEDYKITGHIIDMQN